MHFVDKLWSVTVKISSRRFCKCPVLDMFTNNKSNQDLNLVWGSPYKVTKNSTYVMESPISMSLIGRDFCTSPFLGGLSLHLNHLIAWRTGISFWHFGTLSTGIFLSNLDSKHLMTSPRTLLGQFWHMSIFGNSGAVWVICQKKMASENQFFLDKGVIGLQSVSGFVGGQIPRQYGGTTFGGLWHT